MLDDAMLKTKKFKEFMEPLDKRIEDVQRFLRIFKRGLVYEVYKNTPKHRRRSIWLNVYVPVDINNFCIVIFL